MTQIEIEMIRRVIVAKLNYWTALHAVETAQCGPDQSLWSDFITDKVEQRIDELAYHSELSINAYCSDENIEKAFRFLYLTDS